MRRPLLVSVVVSALTLWIDGLVMLCGDAGPVGWLMSMAIPQLFALPASAVALWSLWRRERGAALLSLTVATAQVLGPMGLCFGRPLEGRRDLRVMSYNVGQFQALKWPEPTVSWVAKTIHEASPDVACLQEAHYHGRAQFGARLADELPGYHSYIKGGMVVLSKRPIRSAETQMFASHYGGHWNVQETMLDLVGKTVRLINVHMVPDAYEPDWWPRLGWMDRIDRKRRLRDEQLAEIMRRVEAKPGPVVVCGDFNTQPFDPRYRVLAGRLTDAFRATHFGFGYTLTSTAPTKRVDYVWTRDVRPLRSRVIGTKASDHMPLVVDLALE